MVKKILIISVFFSLIFTSLFSKENKLINQYRGCDGKVEETSIYSQDQVPIKLIELDTTNYRKW